MKIAILGLGIIGSRCAENLVAAGHEVRSWNRTQKNLSHEVDTLEEAVHDADYISLYLKDAAAVREVLSSLAPSFKKNALLMNHSTINLETTLWLAEECEKLSLRFVDAPFTGSKMAAQDGKLVYYLAGESAACDDAEKALAATSVKTIPMGKVGNATIVKLSTNLISACVVQALAEAQAIAIKNGIPSEIFTKAVMANAGGSVLAAMKLPTMAAGEFSPHFTLDNMRKDSVYVRELAAQIGIETPAIQAVSDRLISLCKNGLGELDYSALAKPYHPL